SVSYHDHLVAASSLLSVRSSSQPLDQNSKLEACTHPCILRLRNGLILSLKLFQDNPQDLYTLPYVLKSSHCPRLSRDSEARIGRRFWTVQHSVLRAVRFSKPPSVQ
ncbi:hypothetical protein C8R45DRAFT_1213415, partial [Mycena sanguinolenta]